MLGHSRASSSKRTSRSIAMVLSDTGSDARNGIPWPLSYIFVKRIVLWCTCDPLWSKGMQGRSPVFRTVKSKSLGMDLEDVGTTFQIWQAELNLSVQTSESFTQSPGKATLRTVHLCSSTARLCQCWGFLILTLEVYQGSVRQRPVQHCTTPGYGDRFGVGSMYKWTWHNDPSWTFLGIVNAPPNSKRSARLPRHDQVWAMQGPRYQDDL